MKKIRCFIFAFFAALGMCSCEKVIDRVEYPDYARMYLDHLKLVGKHLHFDSQESFDEFFGNLSDDGQLTKAAGAEMGLPEGFISVVDRLSGVGTKADGGMDVDKDEYLADRAVQLLVDPKLRYVMDTALVIGVGPGTYKITDLGTYYVAGEMLEDELQAVVDASDRESLSALAKGNSVDLPGGVKFIRSFAGEEAGDECFDSVEHDGEETKAGYGMSNSIHSGYNLTTYHWKGNAILEFLLIKDVTEYYYVDSDRRVAVQLYNNNFGFVEAAGLKTRVQVKKRFLFIPYWAEESVSRQMVNGFDYLYSKHKNYMNSTELVAFQPSNFSGFSSMSQSVYGAGSVTWLYGRSSSVPYIDGFGGDYTLCLPKLGMSGVSVTSETRTMLDKLYDAEPVELLSVLKAAASRRGSSTTPALLFIPKPAGAAKFNNDVTMLTGKYQSYGSSALARLLSKGGFSWSGGIPCPIQFSVYDIYAVDCFGAVNVNGRWVGVRFVFEEN